LIGHRQGKVTKEGMVMKTARQVLNELKWRKDRDFSLVHIFYVHRGAPKDTMELDGYAITGLDQLFFHTDEADIPYHRIFKITYDGKTVFYRKNAKKGMKEEDEL
jgi:uncharacterized protein (UPF0248 family)